MQNFFKIRSTVVVMKGQTKGRGAPPKNSFVLCITQHTQKGITHLGATVKVFESYNPFLFPPRGLAVCD
jgi:hypothetical protein